MSSEKLDEKRPNKEKQPIFTRETVGIILILFSTLALICLITGESLFSTPGKYVSSFLLGCFGYFAFAISIWVIVMGVLLFTDKKTGLSKKRKLQITGIIVLLAFLIHAITMNSFTTLSYGDYLSKCYLMADGGLGSSSGGGIIVGLVCYLLTAVLSNVGCYVVVSALIGLLLYFIIKDVKKHGAKGKQSKGESFRSSYVPNQTIIDVDVSGVEEKEYPIAGVNFEEVSNKPTQKLFVTNAEDFALKTKRELKKEDNSQSLKVEYSNGLGVGKVSTYSNLHDKEIQDKLSYIKTPAEIDLSEKYKKSSQGTTISSSISRTERVETIIPVFEHDQTEKPVQPIDTEKVPDDSAKSHAETFSSSYAEIEDVVEPTNVESVEPSEIVLPVKETIIEPQIPQRERSSVIPFLDETNEIETPINKEPVVEEKVEEKPDPTLNATVVRERRVRNIFFGQTEEQASAVGEEKSEQNYTSKVESDGNAPTMPRQRKEVFPVEQPKVEEVKEEKVEEKPKKELPPINREYFRPPLELLENRKLVGIESKEPHEERQEIIKQTLEDFHINAVPQSFVHGPSITRYEIMMPAGVSVKKVLALDDDLRMRLASRDGVRIQAPIPGKNLVGVEVANNHKVPVGLREVMENSAGVKAKPSSLIFALGKDIVGNAITDDLAKGPHYLVAGATGSGKSVCLNVMIISLLMRYSPEELRLILIDPKRVGFRCYEHIPHLMIDEIVTEPQKAVTILQWAYDEMERRYKMFEDCVQMISNIEAYNEEIASKTVPKMPRIVIVVDELADLMETCKRDMEEKIRKLAAKSRAAGIHLVLATQRPSVDVVTGTIKANLPSRIALKVTNFNDSQTILAEAGAEKLLGNGDMLYKNSGMSETERYQGAWISDREINAIVTYIKEHNKAYFDDELAEYLERATNPKQEESSSGGEDFASSENDVNDLFLKALALGINVGMISISQIQRRFQVGYARAGGIIDKMERFGYISTNEGSKARKVLITREQFEEKYGPMPD